MSKQRISLIVVAAALSALASLPRPAAAIVKCAFHATCPVKTCCCVFTTGRVTCVNNAAECTAFCGGGGQIS